MPTIRSREKADAGSVEAPEGTLPLSQTPPGLRVRVEEVLFDVPRDRCEELGVEPEAVLRCMAWLPDAILVQRPDGETTRIDVALADFVSVRPEHSDGGDDRGHGRFRRERESPIDRAISGGG